MSYFKNKVVWITGASSGIGEECAMQLAKEGATLILSSRKEDALASLKSSLEQKEKHVVQVLDLADSSKFDEITSSLISTLGRIDVLINNGGISQRGLVRETDLEVDRRIMEVNFFGNIALTKAVLPHMIEQKSGHFVVVSSIAGKFGFFLRSAYSASKHALYGFYESLMLEEEGHGVKVTMVCPGKINTPISTNALNSEGKSHGVMDHNQASGMPVEECVKIMLDSVRKGKKDVLIGNKEIKAVTLKRFFPKLFWKVIRKQSPV